MRLYTATWIYKRDWVRQNLPKNALPRTDKRENLTLLELIRAIEQLSNSEVDKLASLDVGEEYVFFDTPYWGSGKIERTA